jgi:glycosyltransferase involved in cell wall biosynthesis
VLHVVPDISRAFGGPTQALLGYLAASLTAGIDAAVAAPQPPAEDLAWFRGQAGDTSVHAFPAWGRGPARLSPALLSYLGTELRSVDVVHVHGLFNAISTLAARRCRRARVPYIIRPFGTLSRYTFEHRRTILKLAYFSILDAPAIRAAGALHFTTVEERDEARRLAAVRAVPASVVPPPWLSDAGSAANVGRRVARVREDSGPETVLFLSRLHRKKGLETLIDAWPAVRIERPTARLIIAGSGHADYERELRARVLRDGNDGSVHFTGFVTGAEKARWLAEADVFVLPSFHENFGVSVLEAVASGMPAVVSPDVQLAAVVEEHRLGAVVPRDPTTLARGILSVLGDKALRQRCASQGAAVIQSLFSPTTIGAQLRTMYEVARSRSTI